MITKYERSLLECTRQGLLFKTWVRPRAQDWDVNGNWVGSVANENGWTA